MPGFAITCRCGERYHFDEANLERVITCWRCKRKLKPRRPARTRSSEIPLTDPIKRSRGPRRAPALHLGGLKQRLLRLLLRTLPFGRRATSLPITLLAVAAWGYLGFVLLAAWLMWQFGDRVVVGTVLLFVGRWVYLVPLALLVFIAARVRRELLLPLGAALGVVIWLLMDFHTGWRRLLPRPEGTPIRVVTFNTANNPDVAAALPGLLERWQPDVVLLQECGSALADAAGRIAGWYSHDARPLCLMSRFPIRAAEVMDRSSLARVRSEGVSSAGGAGYVVRYVLDTPAGPVGVTNLHLETARKGLETLLGDFDLQRIRENTELRDIEGDRARAWVNGGMSPTIVAGDFNTPREGQNFRTNWRGLENAFVVAGTGFGATRLNGWIRLRIDHVLYGTGVRAVRAVVGSDAGSDHLPLIVDLVRLARATDR